MKKLRHLNKIIVLIGVLMLISACASNMGAVQLYKGTPQPDSAVAKIRVPLDIDVVEINGKAVSEPLLASDYVELQILPGTYSLSLRYDRIWDVGKEDHTKIKSEPVTKSLTVHAGHVYRIEHDNPETLKSAQAYVENFDYRVRDFGAKSNSAIGVIIATETIHATDGGRRNRGVLAPLEQLKYWWGQANDAERQGFHEWIGRPHPERAN